MSAILYYRLCLLLPIASALLFSLYDGRNAGLIIIEASFLISMPPYIVLAIVLFWRFRGRTAPQILSMVLRAPLWFAPLSAVFAGLYGVIEAWGVKVFTLREFFSFELVIWIILALVVGYVYVGVARLGFELLARARLVRSDRIGVAA